MAKKIKPGDKVWWYFLCPDGYCLRTGTLITTAPVKDGNLVEKDGLRFSVDKIYSTRKEAEHLAIVGMLGLVQEELASITAEVDWCHTRLTDALKLQKQLEDKLAKGK